MTEPDVTGTTDQVTLWLGYAIASMAEGKLVRARLDIAAALDALNVKIEDQEGASDYSDAPLADKA